MDGGGDGLRDLRLLRAGASGEQNRFPYDQETRFAFRPGAAAFTPDIADAGTLRRGGST
jgi:hypothetical protein